MGSDSNTGFNLMGGKAYRIFYDELHKHLKSVQFIVVDEELPPLDEHGRFSAVFHTIKGGAGFFGLKNIAQIAGDLEKILGATDPNSKNYEQIKSLLVSLQDLGSALPEPVILPEAKEV